MSLWYRVRFWWRARRIAARDEAIDREWYKVRASNSTWGDYYEFRRRMGA